MLNSMSMTLLLVDYFNSVAGFHFLNVKALFVIPQSQVSIAIAF